MTQRRLLISFSGGETSAYMTWMILARHQHRYDVILIVFSNTSQERNECLDFVERCDKELFATLGGFVVWLEPVQRHGQRKRAGFVVVNWHVADRSGDAFEDMIRKYGIPNKSYPHCTRELKESPITSFAEHIGWAKGSYDTAIGIRADEIDRMSASRDKKRLVYPLVQWEPTTKPQINSWWAQQPFRLVGKSYEGNCKWCWKKSFRKHITLHRDDPTLYDFPERMERLYGYHGHEFRQDTPEMREKLAAGYRRVFFRESKSTADIRAMALNPPDTYRPADDDSVIYDVDLDTAGGCGESCEVFTDNE